MSDVHRSRFRIAGRKYRDASSYWEALSKAILERVASGVSSPAVIGDQLGKDRTYIFKVMHGLVGPESQKIAQQLKFTSTGRVERTQEQAEQAAYQALSYDSFAAIPSVAKWIHDQEKRGVRPRGILNNVTGFKRACDLLKLSPDRWTVSREINEELLFNVLAAAKAANPSIREGGLREYRMVVRNFANSHGVGWDRGAAPEIASGKKVNYGEYSRIAASDEQREGIQQYAAKHFPRNLALAVILGHEVVTPRDETLRTLRCGQIRFTMRNGFPVAEFEVYEGKTESTWPKQAFDPRVVALLRHEVFSRPPDHFLLGNGEPPKQSDLADALHEAYAAVGIDVKSDGNQRLINYWKDKPIHAMRHTTAHMWTRRSGGNAALVAKQGWKTTDIVSQVYANMSLEEAWNLNRCDYCKPDSRAGGDHFFCSWKCSLSWLNGAVTRGLLKGLDLRGPA